MKRDYSDGVKDDVVYFTGYEVEKTPAFDMDTLFVVGCRPLKEVIEHANKHHVDHIYLGANQSFQVKLPHGDDATNKAWDTLVYGLLKLGYTVTLDYDVKYHEYVIESKNLHGLSKSCWKIKSLLIVLWKKHNRDRDYPTRSKL